MPLPSSPQPGMVIHYDYLWRHEYERGWETGAKRRPCAIVVATHDAANGRIETVVAPITHVAPTPPSDGVLLPPRVKLALGLDDAPSWVVVTDLNVFSWPGPDIHAIPGQAPGTFVYGFLPPRLFDRIAERIVAWSCEATPRTE